MTELPYNQRPLTDGDIFPFGLNRKKGRKMMDVQLQWYRWFLQECKEAKPWTAAWPNVRAYALLALEDERARERRAITNLKPSSTNPPRPKSDPAKAAAALEAMKKFREGNI